MIKYIIEYILYLLCMVYIIHIYLIYSVQYILFYVFLIHSTYTYLIYILNAIHYIEYRIYIILWIYILHVSTHIYGKQSHLTEKWKKYSWEFCETGRLESISPLVIMKYKLHLKSNSISHWLFWHNFKSDNKIEIWGKVQW